MPPVVARDPPELAVRAARRELWVVAEPRGMAGAWADAEARAEARGWVEVRGWVEAEARVELRVPAEPATREHRPSADGSSRAATWDWHLTDSAATRCPLIRAR